MTDRYPDYMQAAVAQFHDAFDMPNLAKPSNLPTDRIELRVGLIREEGVDELAHAASNGDVVGTIDALIDTIVVCHGALVEMGQQVIDTHQPSPTDQAHDPKALLNSGLEVAKAIDGILPELENIWSHQQALHAVFFVSSIIKMALGVLIESGTQPEPFFDEVHRANMSKLGADGRPIHSRGMELDGAPAGKTLKGPDYSPPDLAGVYARLYGKDALDG